MTTESQHEDVYKRISSFKNKEEQQSTLDIYVFNEKVSLSMNNRYFETKIEALGVDFKVSFNLVERFNHLYEEYYTVVIKGISGQIEETHIWTINQVKAEYERGVLEKFLVRTIFSRKVSNAILHYYKY